MITYVWNTLRAWAASSFIQLGFAIAPPHYIESLMGGAPAEE